MGSLPNYDRCSSGFDISCWGNHLSKRWHSWTSTRSKDGVFSLKRTPLQTARVGNISQNCLTTESAPAVSKQLYMLLSFNSLRGVVFCFCRFGINEMTSPPGACHCWSKGYYSLYKHSLHDSSVLTSNGVTYLAVQKRHRQSRWRSEVRWRPKAVGGLLCSGSGLPGCAWAERSWCPPQGWQRRYTPRQRGRMVPAKRKCWSCLLTCASGFRPNSPSSVCRNRPHARALAWWWWQIWPGLPSVDGRGHVLVNVSIYFHQHPDFQSTLTSFDFTNKHKYRHVRWIILGPHLTLENYSVL